MADTTEFAVKYDGIEYVIPFNLTGLESIELRRWSGGLLAGGVEYLKGVGGADPAALAAGLTFAMRRRGVDADFEKIAGDIGMMEKLEFVDAPEDEGDDVPPTSVAEATGQGSTPTHDGIGGQS